jgi:hypothetical protein
VLTGPAGSPADTLRLELLDPDGETREITRPGGEPAPIIRGRGLGYRLELFGVPWRQPPIGHPSFAPPSRSYFQMPVPLPDGSGHRLGIDCWHAFGWFDGSPIYAELIWSGDPPEADWSIHGLGRPPSDDEWRRAKRVLELFQLKFKRPGGRPNRRPPAFRAQHARWAAAFKRKYGRSPTPYDAEDRFGVSRKTITRWLGEADA